MSDKPKLLVVDDDPDMLDQVSAILSAAGYDVVTSSNQKDAQEMLLSVHPDLAILDLMMDTMDSGFIVCHDLKRLYPDTPVIMLTAVTTATGLSFSANSPEAQSWVKADKVLDKPARPEQILAEVRRLLKRPCPQEAPKGHH